MTKGKLTWAFFCFASLIGAAIRTADVDYVAPDMISFLMISVGTPLSVLVWAYFLASAVKEIYIELQKQKKQGEIR